MLLNSKTGIFFIASLMTTAIVNVSTTFAHPLDFTVHNHTDHAIVSLNVSDSNIVEWEEDVLGVDFLPPDKDVGIYFSGPLTSCLFDIRVLFADGDIAEQYGIDLCQISDFYINPYVNP